MGKDAHMVKGQWETGFEAAQEAIEQTKKRFAFDQSTYSIGVANFAISIFVLAKWPQFYWMLHTVKSCILFIKVITKRWGNNNQFQCLDLCWVYNFAVNLVLGYKFCQYVGGDLGEGEYVISNFTMSILFGFANGPLSVACVTLQNALVFHHFDHTASLFIHFSPLIFVWTLRWYAEEINSFYPNMIETPIVCPGFKTYFMRSFAVYMIWWLLFTVWMLVDGIDRPKKGYGTIWAYMNKGNKMGKMFEKNTGVKTEKGHILLYMCGHAVTCVVAIIFGRITFNHFAGHCVWLIIVGLTIIRNGSHYYKYILGPAYMKSLKSRLRKETK